MSSPQGSGNIPEDGMERMEESEGEEKCWEMLSSRYSTVIAAINLQLWLSTWELHKFKSDKILTLMEKSL